jgi:hypothetical protein
VDIGNEGFERQTMLVTLDTGAGLASRELLKLTRLLAVWYYYLFGSRLCHNYLPLPAPAGCRFTRSCQFKTTLNLFTSFPIASRCLHCAASILALPLAASV